MALRRSLWKEYCADVHCAYASKQAERVNNQKDKLLDADDKATHVHVLDVGFFAWIAAKAGWHERTSRSL